MKAGDELSAFIIRALKRGIEKVLEAELDAHWDYDKPPRQHIIILVLSIKKKIKTPIEASKISVQRNYE